LKKKLVLKIRKSDISTQSFVLALLCFYLQIGYVYSQKSKIDSLPIYDKNASFYSKQFQQQYINEKIDSCFASMDLWEKTNGVTEATVRGRLLLSIGEQRFNESLLPNNLFDFVDMFRGRIDTENADNLQFYYDDNAPYYSYLIPGADYDKFTKEMANTYGALYKSGQPELLICRLYSGKIEEFYTLLQDSAYKNTRLQKLYFEMIEAYTNTYLQANLTTGYWIPTQNLKTLGSHFDVGFQIGLSRNKMTYKFNTHFQLGNRSQTDYFVNIQNNGKDSLITSNFFRSFNFGFQTVYALYQKNNITFEVLTGLGLESFELLEPDKNRIPEILRINSLFGEIGGGISWNLPYKNAFGIQFSCMYGNLDNKGTGATNLQGGILCIHLIWEFFGNRQLYSDLKDLYYYKH